MPLRLIKKLGRRLFGRSQASATSEVASQTTPEAVPLPPSTVPTRRRPARAADGPANETPPVAPRWTLDQYQVPPLAGRVRFHDLELPDELMHAIADLGFQYCTPIQAQSIPLVLGGHDISGRAQTGTGKTAAFLVAMFTHFIRRPEAAARRPGAPRALILAPTRELVMQIAKDAEALGRYLPFRNLAVFGGMDFDRQLRFLQQGPVDLIAATPGRLLDFKSRGHLDLSQVEFLVIDEADRMLDMGFIPDVRRIVRATPPREKRRALLFSATLSEEVMKLASQWMREPVVVEIEPEQVAVDTVEQRVYVVSSREKFNLLYHLLQRPEYRRVLVFGNRRDSTQALVDRMQRHGLPCALLSGAVAQNRRMRILEDFRSGQLRVVVATDVAGRGIHVDGVSHVINYDFPYEPEDYVHRIGRTGRAGASGTAVSFACEDESFIIPEIEKMIGEPLRCVVPDAELVASPPPPRHRAESDDAPRESAPDHHRSGGGRAGGGRSFNRGGPRRGPPRRR